jgi:8-oxo-dGTP diphosphatase
MARFSSEQAWRSGGARLTPSPREWYFATGGLITRDVPLPTVDTIIELPEGIVLIRRRYPPLGWALPGGFVEYGETVEAAAAREAREETGLEVELVELFHVYSHPARDPRRHTIGTVFIGIGRGTLHAGDDAGEAAVVTEETLPSPLAFDHARILADYFRYRRTGLRPVLVQP